MYARYGLPKTIAITWRFEAFDDRDGIRTGLAQKLAETTGTIEWEPLVHLHLRGEWRSDQSTAEVFNRSGSDVATQNTASLSVTYSF